MSGRPATWLTAALGGLADVQLGKMLDRKRTSGTSLPYLRNANVRWGRFDLSDLQSMPFEPREMEKFAVRRGDVLVCEGGEPGRAAVWQRDDLEMRFQKALHRVRLPSSVNPLWLVYQLMFDSSSGALAERFTGTTIGHLPREVFLEYQLRLAPEAEQERIVDAIESYFTRLDDAVATLVRVQRNLKRYRASVLKAAVEGRLVPTEAELALAEGRDYEPASVLLQRVLSARRRNWTATKASRTYREPAAPDTTDLPDLPDGWCWVSVDQLATSEPNALTDGPFGSNLMTAHYTESGPRVIRLQNIGDGIFEDAKAHVAQMHFAKLVKHSVQAGDLVVASLGEELPRACVVPDHLGPALVKADCLRFAVDSQLASNHYVMHALNAFPTRRRTEALVHGVGRPRIGLTLFRQLPLPLAPRHEQQRIVNEVERLQSVASSSLGAAQYNHSRLTRLRQSILKWAFEGRLVDQDPNDEPASVLLERIKAERAAAASAAKPHRGNPRARKTS